jgi:large subunit ribosomal protein L15
MQKKRTKRSRLRGRRTCGYGHKFKHRGKGSKGGKGMAGTGKRAGHRKTWLLKYIGPNYLGKTGFTSKKKRLKTINVGLINDKIAGFIKKGLAKKTGDGFEIMLKGYKILASGKINKKLIIHAPSFSKGAEEKIIKVGGSIKKI